MSVFLFVMFYPHKMLRNPKMYLYKLYEGPTIHSRQCLLMIMLIMMLVYSNNCVAVCVSRKMITSCLSSWPLAGFGLMMMMKKMLVIEGQKSSRIKILHSRDVFVLAIFMQQQMKPYCSGRFICARFISSQSKSWSVKEQLL